MRASIGVLAVVVLSGCSVVKSSRVRDDWATEDATKVKRIALVVQPMPDNKQKVGEAWARIARRYVNQKRNFIVKSDVTQTEPADLKVVCAEGTEGMLWLSPIVTAKGDGVEANVTAKLVRCRDAQEVWASEGGGSFKTQDKLLVEVASSYGKEYGAEVEPYVPAAMNLLRPMLDTLPNPTLTSEEEDEKIAADE